MEFAISGRRALIAPAIYKQPSVLVYARLCPIATLVQSTGVHPPLAIQTFSNWANALGASRRLDVTVAMTTWEFVEPGWKLHLALSVGGEVKELILRLPTNAELEISDPV